MTINKNLAAWNGATTVDGGQIAHAAIILAELPLPGAKDVGDVDQNGRVNLTDAVLILNYLFRGGWQPRRRLSDVDGDSRIGITDAVLLLKYLFSGQALPEPK